tara:strand:+ start:2157 stop:2531 length:375 start_codon:yes stop_codon:yes gene_type:complete
MANQTILKTVVLNIDAILSLLQDETGSDDLKNQFASIKENVIQRIASAETSKKVFSDIPEQAKISINSKSNTYRIQEETTMGWTEIDEKYQNLSKETAKEKYQLLLSSGDYNPNRLRLVVDGQV